MKGSSRHPKKTKKRNIFSSAAIKTLELEVQAAWAERDMEKCIELLHQVLRRAPKNLEAKLLMGRAHGMQFEYDKALDSFESAVKTAPQHQRSIVLLKAGIMARNFYDPNIAESLFEKAVNLTGTVSTKLHFAEFLLRIRKRDAAKLLVDEALESDPDDPIANFMWCRLNEDRCDESIDKLRQIIRNQTHDLKAKAGYQLAKILDIVGDYDNAMQSLVTAKATLMPARDVAVQIRRKNREKLMNLARGFDAETRLKWQTESDQLYHHSKLALLGGHPRSGTTLLEQVLDSHPEIITAEETEIFFMFSLSPLMRKHPPDAALLDVLNLSTAEDCLGARDRYYAATERCLGASVGARFMIDKNPSLTSLVPAMFRIFPEIKYIIMIRDPRDVVLSCFMQSFVPVSGLNANYLTLEDTAAEYADVMGIWTNVRDRFNGNFCEIRYEEMVEDLETNARKAIDFIGMDWSDSVMNYDQHARKKIIRSPTANAVTEKVHGRAISRWKNYEKYFEPVIETLAPCLENLDYV